MASATPLPDVLPETDTDTQTRRQPPYAVILHNDDVNGMDFVVMVLRKVFGYADQKCIELMIEAHEKGRAVVWVGALEVAELKADQIRSCGPDPDQKRKGASRSASVLNRPRDHPLFLSRTDAPCPSCHSLRSCLASAQRSGHIRAPPRRVSRPARRRTHGDEPAIPGEGRQARRGRPAVALGVPPLAGDDPRRLYRSECLRRQERVPQPASHGDCPAAVRGAAAGRRRDDVVLRQGAHGRARGVWTFRLVSSPLAPAWRGEGKPVADGVKAAAILLALPAIIGDLSHNNVNIFILFLVAACLELYRHGRDSASGLVLGFAIACKVTPLLFLAYFAWKRAWRVVAACVVGLVLWLAIVPGAVFGWERNAALLTDWYRLMIERPVLKGEITTEHPNQALPGFIYRLFTHSPSFIDYEKTPEGDIPVPAAFHNLADIGRPAAWVVVKLLTVGFVLAVVLLCRRREPSGRAGDSRPSAGSSCSGCCSSASGRGNTTRSRSSSRPRRWPMPSRSTCRAGCAGSWSARLSLPRS